MTKDELTEVVDQLIQQGEDKEEMDYWLDIYDDLDPEDQEALSENLKQELVDLQKIQGN